MHSIPNRLPRASRPAAPLALAAVIAGLAAAGEEPPAPAPEPGTFWTRDTLTGGWWGLGPRLAGHGVVFDLSATGYYAGLLDGGRGDDGFEAGGRADAFLHLDSDKLGLWDGGGLHVHGEMRYGESADRTAPRSGGLWPPNSGVVLPLGDPDRLVASSIYFTQSIGDNATLMLGKINAVDLLASDPFFGGWARDRFTNIAFVAPPSGVVPPTIMGGVLSVRQKPLSYTLMVFDPDDRTNDYWPDDLFHNGVNVSLAATWSGAVAGRPSSFGITGTYSTKDGADLSDLLLPPDIQGGTKDGSFNVAVSFSHLLVESETLPGKGFGVYAKAAIADGNPNAIQASLVGGFAGHGVVPGRPDDCFGIGYYYYNFSNDLQSALRPLASLNDEQGVEIYYNFAVTPWFRVTPDIQWIDPARGTFPSAWVGGIRASVTF